MIENDAAPSGDTPDLQADAREAAEAEAARHRVETVANPNTRVDYMVRLQGETAGTADAKGAHVILRYVPDRLIVRESAFRAYLEGLHGYDDPPSAMERLALRILSDLNDELVPRWLQVTVTGTEGSGHRVLVQDRQPKWDNPQLIQHAGGI